MTIAFDPDRHSELIAAIRAAANNIQAELDALDAEVGAVRVRWNGAAQDAYDQASQRWASSMASLAHALDDAASAAQSAGSRLTQADRDASSLWA